MNEVLRILDRILKKQGYSIKKHPQYNLLPLKNFEGFSDQKLVYSELDNANGNILIFVNFQRDLKHLGISISCPSIFPTITPDFP